MFSNRSAVAAVILFAVIAGTAYAYEPHVNYMLQCMGCHTPDGSGEPGRVPSIRNTLGPLSSIADGRRFLVQVPGSAQSRLSDAELAELLNWMIQNLAVSSQRERFIPYTAREVARYRGSPLVDVRGTRRRLLDLPAVRRRMAEGS